MDVDDATGEFAAADEVSAAAEVPPVTADAVVRVGLPRESAPEDAAVEDVEDAGPAEDEVVSLFVEAVAPPVPADPPDSSEPPEAPAG